MDVTVLTDEPQQQQFVTIMTELTRLLLQIQKVLQLKQQSVMANHQP